MKMIISVTSALLVFQASIGSTGSPPKHKNWKHLPSPDECGMNNMRSRIIGGAISDIGQFPWLARLGYKRGSLIKFQCGGTLISYRHVVTAAHCVYGSNNKPKVVRVGANLPALPMVCTPRICPFAEDIDVETIIPHPEFNQTTLRNDIALVILKRPAKETDFTHPICLPTGQFSQRNFFGEKLTVAGWGRDDVSAETMSLALKHVDLPMRDRCLCEANYSPIKLDETQFCVGLETGEDSCDGDSGGPLMYYDRRRYKKKYYLLGVVSFGKAECGESPSVYTNAMAFIDWILDNIEGNEYEDSFIFPETTKP